MNTYVRENEMTKLRDKPPSKVITYIHKKKNYTIKTRPIETLLLIKQTHIQ